MDMKNTLKDRRKFANRSAVLSILLALSITSNAIEGVLLYTDNKIVLVPTMPQTMSINPNGAISRDYLEFLARDITWLFLNRTSSTAKYLEQAGVELIDPSVYEPLRLQLERQSRLDDENHQTQSFAPADFYVDPANLYVEVMGDLTVISGNATQDSQQKIYALTFTRHGSRVLLKEIKEITKDEAKGPNVKTEFDAPAAPVQAGSESE